MTAEPVPERTPPDDTTESLRERITWLRDRWYQRPGLSEEADALDAALDEFAEEAAGVERLRAELAEAQEAYLAVIEAAELRGTVRHLTAAIGKLSARHQPKTVPGVRNCGQHSARGVCTDCETYEALVCSNLTCCEYPCDDRRAIDAALAVPEGNEVAPTEAASRDVQWFAADVARLVKDYAHEERGVIALTPFEATLDQLCLEKYGFDLDRALAALYALETPGGAPQIIDEKPIYDGAVFLDGGMNPEPPDA